MRFHRAMLAGLIAAGASAPVAKALEVDREVLPRITVGGRLLATPMYESNDGFGTQSDDSTNEIDVSDSAFLLRFDKRTYSQKGVAGAVLGLRKTSTDSDLGDDVFFHQLNAFYWNRDYQVVLGRTRLRNFLIEFPTVRDEDLIDYVYVPNASSYREAEEDQFYATQAAFDWYVGKKSALSIWTAARVETDNLGEERETAELNSAGIGWRYATSEQLRYVERIREAGVMVDFQNVDDPVTGLDDTMHSITAGAEWNLNRDPSHNWSMAVQGVYNKGFNDIVFNPAAGDAAQRIAQRRAKSRTAVVSLRYTDRPKLLTRSQYAVSLAYKDYPDRDSASQWSIIPSYVYQLGHATDFVAQYIHTKRDDGLAALTGFDTERKLMVGLVFGFDQTFNDQIGERKSILNLEHGYIQ